jgi:hypothetical protein
LKKGKANEKEEKYILSRSVNCIMIIVCSQCYFALLAGSSEPVNFGRATVVIVDLVDS